MINEKQTGCRLGEAIAYINVMKIILIHYIFEMTSRVVPVVEGDAATELVTITI